MLKIFMTAFVFFTIVDLAQAKVIGEAKFHTIGEGLAIDIDGVGGKVESVDAEKGGKVEGSRFSVKLAEFKTGMDLRDKHMCDALECKKFPLAQFTLTKFQKGDGPIEGALTLHGVTRRIQGWTAKVDGSKISVSGKILLSDFGIKAPNYKLAQVSDVVEVAVEVNI